MNETQKLNIINYLDVSDIIINVVCTSVCTNNSNLNTYFSVQKNLSFEAAFCKNISRIHY